MINQIERDLRSMNIETACDHHLGLLALLVDTRIVPSLSRGALPIAPSQESHPHSIPCSSS